MKKQQSEILQRLEYKRRVRRFIVFAIYVTIIFGLLGLVFSIVKPTFFVGDRVEMVK